MESFNVILINLNQKGIVAQLVQSQRQGHPRLSLMNALGAIGFSFKMCLIHQIAAFDLVTIQEKTSLLLGMEWYYCVIQTLPIALRMYSCVLIHQSLDTKDGSSSQSID